MIAILIALVVIVGTFIAGVLVYRKHQKRITEFESDAKEVVKEAVDVVETVKKVGKKKKTE